MAKKHERSPLLALFGRMRLASLLDSGVIKPSTHHGHELIKAVSNGMRSWCLELPAHREFVQLIQTDSKETSKVLITVPLWLIYRIVPLRGNPPVTGGFPTQRG